MSDRDELRQAVARVIAERLSFNSTDEVEAAADAAIAAYEAHRPRLTAPENCQCGYDDQCAFAARAEKAEAERDELMRQIQVERVMWGDIRALTPPEVKS